MTNFDPAAMSVANYNSIFGTGSADAAEQQERIQFIPLSELHPFPNHSFRVVNDERMQDNVKYITETPKAKKTPKKPIEIRIGEWR